MFNLNGNLIDLENLQVVKKLIVGPMKFLALHYKNKNDQDSPIKIQYKSESDIDDAILKIGKEIERRNEEIKEAIKNQRKVSATLI